MNKKTQKSIVASILILALTIANVPFPYEIQAATLPNEVSANVIAVDGLNEFTSSVTSMVQNFDEDYVAAQIVYDLKNSTYTLDGKETETSVIIEKIDDAIMVPLDTIAKNLNLKVDYKANVTVTTQEKGEISLSPELDTAVADGVSVELSESPYMSGDTLMVPVEDIAELLYCEVEDAVDGAVTISNSFQTKRLIVQSSEPLEDAEAAQIIQGYKDLYILQYDTQEKTKQAYDSLKNRSGIDFVESDIVMSLEAENGEMAVLSEVVAEYTSWGYQTQYLNDDYMKTSLMEKYGAVEYMPEIVVAVIDTGIDYGHELFSGRIDSRGENLTGSSAGTEPAAQDDNVHGTHVSGIIVEGTLNNVKILPIKALDDEGSGTELEIYTAIQNAIAYKVDVINMSIGGTGTSSFFEDAINEAVEKGIVVVVAAGNENTNISNVTPANVEKAITVAAIDMYRAKAGFSNYGEGIDLSAPGVNIKSANLGGGYVNMSGTSMATPHVAATAALLKTYEKSLDVTEVTGILENNAVDLGAVGRDNYYGSGMVCLTDIPISDYVATKTPVFGIAAGDYDEPLILTITSADANAQIYYTRDGSTPSISNGFLYNGPFSITETTRVKAVSVVVDKADSAIMLADYIIDGKDVPGAIIVSPSGVVTQYTGILTNVDLPEKVNGVTIVAIGENAFSNVQNMQSIVMSDQVATIDQGAFEDCINLISVTAYGVSKINSRAFYNCTALTTLRLTENEIDYIGGEAFAECSSLMSVSFPELTKVESSAFFNCDKLKSVNIPKVTVIGAFAFADYGSTESIMEALNVNWNKLTVVGEYAFYRNPAVTEVSLTNIQELGEGAFYRTENLTKAVIYNISNLEDELFYGDINLKHVELPDTESMGTDVFGQTNKSVTTLVVSSLMEPMTQGPFSPQLTIYGTDNTYAKNFASLYGYTFKVVPAITAPYVKSYEYVNSSIPKAIVISALGIHLKYQWYSNKADSNVNGVILTGENTVSLTPRTDISGTTYYYAVITSTDMGVNTSYKTDPIKVSVTGNEKNISLATVKLWTSSYTYNGSYQNPAVTVQDGAITLRPEIDYTVTYENNIKVGTATVTITGKGNYKGSIGKTFAITKADLKITLAKTSITKIYGNKAFSLGVKSIGTLQYKSSKPSIVSISTTGKLTIKGIGKATITITASGSNYNTTIKKVTITVKPKKATIKSMRISGKKTIKLTWKKDSKATGYEIQYSTSSKFTAKSTKKVVISQNSVLSKTISKLTTGTKYYVRIRSYKKYQSSKFYGAWSSIKKVKAQ